VLDIITPDWPAPGGIRAAFTTRSGGVSQAPFDSLNLGMRIGDEVAAVSENRRLVRAYLQMPAEPTWLEQVHGAAVVRLEDPQSDPVADAAVTRARGHVCAIRVADCMPVLFAARDGSTVGAAHAGWRGLAAGVLEATVRQMAVAPAQLLAWLGPAIGPAGFEVGAEVRAAFVHLDAGAAEAFRPNARGRWQCDLYALARRRLARLGVGDIHGGGWCTYSTPERFFSYRRAGRCGRMAALIWKV
jgi:hypothetical protein